MTLHAFRITFICFSRVYVRGIHVRMCWKDSSVPRYCSRRNIREWYEGNALPNIVHIPHSFPLLCEVNVVDQSSPSNSLLRLFIRYYYLCQVLMLSIHLRLCLLHCTSITTAISPTYYFLFSLHVFTLLPTFPRYCSHFRCPYLNSLLYIQLSVSTHPSQPPNFRTIFATFIWFYIAIVDCIERVTLVYVILFTAIYPLIYFNNLLYFTLDELFCHRRRVDMQSGVGLVVQIIACKLCSY